MAAVSEEFGGIDVTATRPFGEVTKGYTAFREGGVLIAKITPCMENGKVAVVPALANHVGYGSTEFHVLRCGNAMLPAWLAHYVSHLTFRKAARQDMIGSAGQLKVSSQWIAGAILPVPPLKEQRRILEQLAETFPQIDDGVAQVIAAKRKLALYRQSLLKSAVDGSLTADWRRLRTDIAWRSATIGQMADVGTGVTPLRSTLRYFVDGTIPWVTSGALNEAVVDRAATLVTIAAVEECRLKIYPAGTLLVAMYGEGKPVANAANWESTRRSIKR